MEDLAGKWGMSEQQLDHLEAVLFLPEFKAVEKLLLERREQELHRLLSSKDVMDIYRAQGAAVFAASLSDEFKNLKEDFNGRT